MDRDPTTPHTATNRIRPRSPNIHIYRPQLTSVLSIINRITGVVLSMGAVALVIWMVAAASGPHAYAAIHTLLASPVGQSLLSVATFAFFMHLLGSIRHLA